MRVHKSSQGQPESTEGAGRRVRDPQAIARGRLGGLARAARLTPEQRSAQSKRAQVSRAILIGLGK